MSQINGNRKDDPRYYPAKILKNAFEQSVSALGSGLVTALIDAMGRDGLDLRSEAASYSLDQLAHHLTNLLGDEATRLVLEHIREFLGPA